MEKRLQTRRQDAQSETGVLPALHASRCRVSRALGSRLAPRCCERGNHSRSGSSTHGAVARNWLPSSSSFRHVVSSKSFAVVVTDTSFASGDESEHLIVSYVSAWPWAHDPVSRLLATRPAPRSTARARELREQVAVFLSTGSRVATEELARALAA